ncbi:MAG: hypothetical protein ACYTEQ_06030 [Planctomycetota bacterium]
MGHDEHMYCTGGVLLAQGRAVYKDFSYVGQMPYHPLLFAVLYKSLRTTGFLLVGRMTSALCDVLVVACIMAIYRRIFGPDRLWGLLLGLSAGVLYLFNPSVDYASGLAWNHDVVILCTMVSLWLLISADFNQKPAYWRVALIGMLLTLASGMRITTVLVQVVFFALLVMQRGISARQRLKTVLWFCLGAGLAAAWPVWTAASAPRAFLLNILHIPALNGEFQRQIGFVGSKPRVICDELTRPGYLLLVLLAICLWAAVGWKRRKLDIADAGKALVCPLLALTFFIIALIPPTMWVQYLALPVPFLVAGLAYPLVWLKNTAGTSRVIFVIMATCVFVSVISCPAVLERVPELFDLERWVPLQVHRIAQDIGGRTRGPKLVLTLAPLYALEGGCGIYCELSAGPFVYRVADFMKPSERQTAQAAGPRTLAQILEKSPPDAVVLGTEPEFLEEPLFRGANINAKQWERKVYENGVVAYFRR